MLCQYQCLKCHKSIEEFSVGHGLQPKKAICGPCSTRILRERVGSILTCGLGVAFLCSLPLWATTPPQTPIAKDRLVGQSSFRIRPTEEGLLMQPILTPRFKLALIKGPSPAEDAIQVCSVLARDMRRDEVEQQVLTVMVLRCGQSEYGVSEVDFQYDSTVAVKKAQ